jgi:hypothetical protein
LGNDLVCERRSLRVKVRAGGPFGDVPSQLSRPKVRVSNPIGSRLMKYGRCDAMIIGKSRMQIT